MSNVIEVSYTGDLLAHRRCPRAWSFDKQAGFLPYESVQVMEGRLFHHAMEWLTRQYREAANGGRHATEDELHEQLNRYFRVLWSRGMRTRFASKQATLDRIIGNIMTPKGQLRREIRVIVESAQHTEYELRAVKKVLPADFGGKDRILLTGVIDLVVQQQETLTYEWAWKWTDRMELTGRPTQGQTSAAVGDVEIWDYKATRAKSTYAQDYVRQLLTYAALYRDRTGDLPVRCVLFYANEPRTADRLLAIPVDHAIVDAALAWTQREVANLQMTVEAFQSGPTTVSGGNFDRLGESPADRVTKELSTQCTACGYRFDCDSYAAYLKRRGSTRDINPLDVRKN